MASRRSAALARLRPLATLFARRFKPLAAVATVAGVALALYSQREAVVEWDWRLSWPALAGSVLLFALAPVLQGLSFWLILRSLAARSPLDETLVVWMRSFLLRYAPSGALAFVIRVRERDRLAASSATVLTASGYEQLAALASGAVACVLGFALAGLWPPLVAGAISAAAIAAAVASRPRFLGRPLQTLLARRGIELPSLLRGRRLALATAVNVLGWLPTGAAAATLIEALGGGGGPGLAWLIGVYAFAWMLGFLVPLAPGGLGLRDGTLAVSLATSFGAGVGTALAVALRLANTLGELAAVGATEAAYRAWRAARGFGRPASAHTRERATTGGGEWTRSAR